MSLSTKTRSVARTLGSGHVTGTAGPLHGGPYEPFEDHAVWGSKDETQITASEGHPWKSRSKGFSGDIGGDFFTQKRYVEGSAQNTTISSGDVLHGFPTWLYRGVYRGPIAPINPLLRSFPPAMDSSKDNLIEAGATAIARCEPTNPIADMSTALGEIYREGLPHIVGSQTWKNRTQVARNAGGEYLNVVFGWLPLYEEAKDFSNGVLAFKHVLEQFERDAGKQVRRTYRFPVRKETLQEFKIENQRAFIHPYNSIFEAPPGSPLGSVVVVRKIEQRRWFSGAFTYHLPSGYDSRNAIDRLALRADRAFGITVTPETLWNLAPWSWATDWFANTGDVISNATSWARYGLVLRYGYIMEHTIVRDTYSWSGPTGYKGGSIPSDLSLVTETKKRYRANPFGFGVEWSGLSPLQLSIAAALGLSRV